MKSALSSLVISIGLVACTTSPPPKEVDVDCFTYFNHHKNTLHQKTYFTKARISEIHGKQAYIKEHHPLKSGGGDWISLDIFDGVVCNK